MKRPDPPCGKKCEDREQGCHSKCEKYQVYVYQNEIYKEEIRKARHINTVLSDLKDHCVRSVTHGAVKRGYIKMT